MRVVGLLFILLPPLPHARLLRLRRAQLLARDITYGLFTSSRTNNFPGTRKLAWTPLFRGPGTGWTPLFQAGGGPKTRLCEPRRRREFWHKIESFYKENWPLTGEFYCAGQTGWGGVWGWMGTAHVLVP